MPTGAPQIPSVFVTGTIVCEQIETPIAHSPPPCVLGGSAIYSAAAAQLLHRTQLVGIVGADFPKRFLDKLEGMDLDMSGLERGGGNSFTWRAEYSRCLKFRKTLALSLGVYQEYRPKIPDSFKRCLYAVIANLQPKIQRDVLDHLQPAGLTLLGTLDYWIEHEPDDLIALLPYVTGFIANEEEMLQLTGRKDAADAAQIAASWGSRFVVVTMAEQGSILAFNNRLVHFPAYTCHYVRDSTGAGDSFAGGLMASLAKDRVTVLGEAVLFKAMRFATAVASFCVESFSIDALSSAHPEEVNFRAHHLGNEHVIQT